MARLTRGTYLRRRIAVFGGTGAVLAGIAYLPLTLLAPLPVATAELAPPAISQPEAARLDWGAGIAGAVGSAEGGDLLGGFGADGALPIASIAKVATVLAVLEKKPLDPGEKGPTITLGARDVQFERDALKLNGRVLRTQVGWRFTERQLIQIALVYSANNYARSLAVWAFGSDAAAVKAVQAYVDAHGLDSMRIDNVTGLSERTVGSAPDLVELGRLALQHPVIAETVALPSVKIAPFGTLKSTNLLVGKYGVIGIKTGTLGTADLLFAADVAVGDRTERVVGAVLGADTHEHLAAAVRKLLGTIRDGYHEVELAAEGDVYGSYTTPWGQTANLVALDPASVVVWSDAEVTRTVDVDSVGAATTGTRVGEAEFTVAGQTIEVPLGLDAPIEDPGPWWRLSHPGLIVGAP